MMRLLLATNELQNSLKFEVLTDVSVMHFFLTENYHHILCSTWSS